MRVMVIIKANAVSEAGVLPGEKMLTEMGEFNEELVKARIFKIDADFVRQAAQMGLDKEPFESLVKMRIFKVTPEFVAEARAEGLGDLTVEQLVKLRIFNIDADFIRRARAEGVPLEVEALVQERIGVGRRRRSRVQ